MPTSPNGRHRAIGPRRGRSARPVLVLVAAVLALLGSLLAAGPAAAATTPTTPTSATAAPLKPGDVVRRGITYHATAKPGLYSVCGAQTPGHSVCDAVVTTLPGANNPDATYNSPIGGLSASQLESLYEVNGNTGGSGVTVGIVDAYDDPNAETDLAAYRGYYGLSACTSANGCFRKVSQTGSTTAFPAADAGWSVEISLDLDMVSAVCPNCTIRLIEANSSANGDLYAAENEAVVQGARYITNSWSGTENSGSPAAEAYFNHPGVVITASSGDNGYTAGVQYPASSQYVTAVGGTVPYFNGSTWSQSAWPDSGSGCSSYIPKPAWQDTIETSCANRAEVDVSGNATATAIYDTYPGNGGWTYVGGTSAAAPAIAAVYALAGLPNQNTPADTPYRHIPNLYDVTTGSNNGCGNVWCVPGAGWDGPTGLGAPQGPNQFVDNGALLYNSSTGLYDATSRTQGNGLLINYSTYTTAGYTSVTPFGEGHLLFYRYGTGAYATGRRLNNGQVVLDYSGGGLSTNWSNITSIGDGYLLFYAQGASTYAIAHRNSAGQLATDYIGSGLSTNWTSIIPLGDNVHLLFWQSASGSYSIAHRSASGALVTDYIGSGLSGYTKLTPFGDGYLLLSNAGGAWEVLGHTSPTAGYLTYSSGTGLGTTWTSITPLGDGHLLFYAQSNGVWAIGEHNIFAQFVFDYIGSSLPIGGAFTTSGTTY
jgi:subtilase family serine protease